MQLRNAQAVMLALVVMTGTPAGHAASTAVTPAPAAQQAAASASQHTTLRQLEQIQAETVILEARAAQARVQKELDEGGVSARLPALGQPPTAMMPATAVAPVSRPLQILEIYGSGKRLIARLALPDGSQVELTAGQRVPGTDVTVTAISAREVRVSDGSRERALPFN